MPDVSWAAYHGSYPDAGRVRDPETRASNEHSDRNRRILESEVDSPMCASAARH